MNSTVCVATDAGMQTRTTAMSIYDVAEENATAPMAVLLPPYERFDEEALHTSFEQAISGRVMAMQLRVQRMSSEPVQRHTDPIAVPHLLRRYRPVWQRWQPVIRRLCLALILMMIGFDLMGLLVLHMMH